MNDAEMVHANIRITFERTAHNDGTDSYTEVRIARVESVSSDLSREEADYLPADIMESSNSSTILNALLDSLAGIDTTL